MLSNCFLRLTCWRPESLIFVNLKHSSQQLRCLKQTSWLFSQPPTGRHLGLSGWHWLPDELDVHSQQNFILHRGVKHITDLEKACLFHSLQESVLYLHLVSNYCLETYHIPNIILNLGTTVGSTNPIQSLPSQSLLCDQEGIHPSKYHANNHKTSTSKKKLMLL